MEHRNRYDGAHPRAIEFIRYYARQLTRHRAVPGMELEDYEQDLMTDLLARERHFDPTRASYPTFADRVIRHRVATLIQSGLRARRLEDQGSGAGVTEPSETQAGSSACACWTEEACSLCLDLERFIGQLPARLRRCCGWLLAENRRAAAAELGLHHSSLYEAARDLKQHAIEAGLQLYLQTDPTPTPPIPAR